MSIYATRLAICTFADDQSLASLTIFKLQQVKSKLLPEEYKKKYKNVGFRNMNVKLKKYEVVSLGK